MLKLQNIPAIVWKSVFFVKVKCIFIWVTEIHCPLQSIRLFFCVLLMSVSSL